MEQLLLAAPSNPSTYLQDTIRISGVLRGVKNPSGTFSLVVNLIESPIKNPQITRRDNDYLIEFDHDFSAYIPKKPAERKYISVQLKYRSENSELTAPTSEVTIFERTAWNKALGGYIFPNVNRMEIASRYLVVEGWAAKRECTQKEVTVVVNGKRFPCPHINVWSPSIGQSVPSIEQANKSNFNVVIERSELYFPIWTHRRLFVEIKFSDGATFKLPKVRVEWKKPQRRAFIKREDTNGILFIANNLRVTEGAPRVLYEIIKLSASLGHKIGVIAPLGGELEENLKELGVEVHLIPELYLAHYSRMENFNNQTLKAKEIIERFNPSVVFGNTIEAFWGISHAQSLGIKTFWLIHESKNPKLAFEELDPRARVSFIEALDSANNIFVSETTAKLFTSKGRTTEIIPNGVSALRVTSETKHRLRYDLRQRLGVADSCPLILNIGTICKRKGQDFLLTALAEVKDLDFMAILVGGRAGEFFEQIKSQIQNLGLESKVILKDETRDVEQYYAAADLFAISSREESAPLVSLEALNWSLPIVSTDAFGLTEQLKDSGAALLSPVENVGIYASHLKQMLSDKDLRIKSGRKGKVWVDEKFNLENSLERYKRILEKNVSK